VYAVNYGTAEHLPRIKELAAKALALDPTLGEAHAVLGLVKSQVEWDFRGAEEEFRRAVELSQQYGAAHHWAGLNLTLVGRFEEAETELRRARTLDPASLMISEGLAENYCYSRPYEEAINRANQILRVEPDAATAHFLLGPAYLEKGCTTRPQPNTTPGLRRSLRKHISKETKSIVKNGIPNRILVNSR
jgi:tetratricopeptide (TPR) repeat protein